MGPPRHGPGRARPLRRGPVQARTLQRPFLPSPQWKAMIHEVEHNALEPASWRSVDITVTKYQEFIATTPFAPFPFNFYNVSAYCLDYCVTQQHTARSLGGVTSRLAKHAFVTNQPWLTDRDRKRLQAVCRGLLKRDHTTPQRKLPIGHAVQQQVVAAIDPANPAHTRTTIAGMVAHDGLLRGSEVVALKNRDLQWLDTERTRCTLTLHKTKANKTGPPEVITLADYGTRSAVYMLRIYMDRRGPADPAAPLFPSFTRPLEHMPVAHFRAAYRALLARAGFSVQHYSSHRFRSGGATDLFHAGCRVEAIRLHGRWKSEAFYIYIRDNPSLRSKEIFSSMAVAAFQAEMLA